MNKDESIEFARNTLQMLVYEEALDLLTEQYIREFVYREEIPNLHTYYLEKNLKSDMLDKAVDKISKIISQAYKEERRKTNDTSRTTKNIAVR